MKTEQSNSPQIQTTHAQIFLIISLRRLNQFIFSVFWIGLLTFQFGLLAHDWVMGHYDNVHVVFGRLFNFKNIF